jgi:hypothetical protein
MVLPRGIEPLFQPREGQVIRLIIIASRVQRRKKIPLRPVCSYADHIVESRLQNRLRAAGLEPGTR